MPIPLEDDLIKLLTEILTLDIFPELKSTKQATVNIYAIHAVIALKVHTDIY